MGRLFLKSSMHQKTRRPPKAAVHGGPPGCLARLANHAEGRSPLLTDRGWAFFCFLLAVCLLLASCETSESKPAHPAPPVQAQAPSVTPLVAPPPKLEAKPAPTPDPVDATLAAVETAYQVGRDNYNAGHLEAAKTFFDHAFDLLLMSKVDVNSDDRLRQEFDKIVEGIHELELEALKQGDGFTEQQSEPAPIDEANEVTFPVDPNIKAKAEQELKTTQSDLPLTLNDAVAAYINYFSSNRGRGFLEHGYVRSGRYRTMILKTLQQEGVPQDLIYLAQAESGFHPLALSRAGARGMWQFMAGRGEQYGLKRNWWLDERQDPELATRAAAHHLKDLYNEFGDWYLAMAAYNSGPGTVQHAVERTGYVDYWELYHRGVLPQETRNYVPIILAITIMSKNPEQYGLDRLQQDSPVAGDVVTIHDPIDLRLAAECVDASVATLQELNPSLLRLTTPKDQPFELHLPQGTKDKFQQAIALIPPDMRVWWRYHRVAPGDTLAGIAHKYHTTASAIQEVNNLTDGGLRGEAKLIIPVTPGRREAEKVSYTRRVTHYKVRRGDTVLSVADRYGVSADSLRRWNHLKGNRLAVGRVLSIHRPAVLAAEEGEPTSASIHKPAGSRTARAKSHSGSPTAGVGSPSKSPVTTTSTTTKTASAKTAPAGSDSGKAPPATSGQVVHRVKKGETLSSIARTYHVSINDLRRNNGKAAAKLRPGTVLIIKRGA